MGLLRSKVLLPFLFFSAIWGSGREVRAQCTNTCRYSNDGDCDDGGPDSDFSFCELGTDCNDCGSRGSGETRTTTSTESELPFLLPESYVSVDLERGEACGSPTGVRASVTNVHTESVHVHICLHDYERGWQMGLMDLRPGQTNNGSLSCNSDGTYRVRVCHGDSVYYDCTSPCREPETSPSSTSGEQTSTPSTSSDSSWECRNTCFSSHDGRCDDGGPGAVSADCELGTDCNDCGAREPGCCGPAATLSIPSESDSSSGCTNTCTYANDGACDDGGPGSAHAMCPLGTDCNDCGMRDPGPRLSEPPGRSCDILRTYRTILSNAESGAFCGWNPNPPLPGVPDKVNPGMDPNDPETYVTECPGLFEVSELLCHTNNADGSRTQVERETRNRFIECLSTCMPY